MRIWSYTYVQMCYRSIKYYYYYYHLHYHSFQNHSLEWRFLKNTSLLLLRGWMRTGVFKYDHVVHHTVLLYWQKWFKYATIDHFQYIIYSYLTPKFGGIKQKKCIIHYWASRWYLLFYSPKPHNQAWILIYRTCIFLKTEKNWSPLFQKYRDTCGQGLKLPSGILGEYRCMYVIFKAQ